MVNIKNYLNKKYNFYYMGNLLYKKEVCKESNDVWFNDLKKWENKIKINNYLKNHNTNNKPDHINILNEWVNKIKLNNFINNNNTNNPPDYVLNLKNENYILNENIRDLRI